MGTYILLITSLFASAIFSGIEIAFYVADKIRIFLEEEKGNKSAKILRYFIEHSDRFITTILVGNNLMLVLFGISSSKMLKPYISKLNPTSPYEAMLLETVISTIIILLLGEFFPKALFRSYPNKMLNTLIPLIYGFYKAIKPVVLLVEKIQKYLFKSSEENSNEPFATEEELEKFLATSLVGYYPYFKTNVFSEIVKNALDFNELKVREFMRPRTEIVGIPINSSAYDAYKIYNKYKYSKYVVYENSLDDIKGYILILDLLKADPEQPVAHFLRDIPVVPESMPASSLIEVFKETSHEIILVIDEYGGTAGIVTIEDLLEEVVGDLMDEFEEAEPKVYIEKQIDENTFILGARLRVDDVNEKFNLNIPEDESYNTIGGWIMSLTGNIPEPGSVITHENLKITIQEATPTTILLVKIEKLED